MRRWTSGPRASDDQFTRALPIAAPTNMLPVQVADRHMLAPDVVSVRIVLPGTTQSPAPYLPGQFVTLALPTVRETLYRSYSLCGDGDPSAPWELTIKRMDGGAVSNFFYQSVMPGTLLYASLPRGTFTLPAQLGPQMVFVFVVTGSGITPLMGMLRYLDCLPEHERPLVQLHYASRTPDDIIYRDELGAMDPDRVWLRQRHYISSRGHRMTVDGILDFIGPLAPRAYWYMCGSDQFKRELQAVLEEIGIPARQVHTEVFASQHGPAYRVAPTSTATEPSDLFIADTGDALSVEPGETLLTALERNGYHPPFSCRAGSCGTCKLRLLEGEVDQQGEMLPAAEKAGGYVLSCIAHPLGQVTLASGGRPPAGKVRRAVAGGEVGRAAGAVTAVRAVALAGVGALLLGAWQLTDHLPASWASAKSAPQPTAPASAEPTGAALATATPTHAAAGGGSQATATPTHAAQGSGGGGVPPAPTATPKPKPAATSTPSPKH
jgi:ferredoxin-NADP reductase